MDIIAKQTCFVTDPVIAGFHSYLCLNPCKVRRNTLGTVWAATNFSRVYVTDIALDLMEQVQTLRNKFICQDSAQYDLLVRKPR